MKSLSHYMPIHLILILNCLTTVSFFFIVLISEFVYYVPEFEMFRVNFL